MLNKLTAFMWQHQMVSPGDRIICALSGGADSVALLFALYLLKEKLGITLEAAHFNHNLRGEESERDEAFVKALCDRYEIRLHCGSAQVVPGEKGLEAAARDARYGFLRSLPGKIATAHTADDNAETVLLHLIRGTGLKGLGGITPVSGKLIRPMLTVTREEVEAFLQEYYVNHIEDSSNAGDQFLRNRVRHHVMPLLKQENPRLVQNLSTMALRLRQDESYLVGCLEEEKCSSVSYLRTLHPALRGRALELLLKQCGVREPEQSHIALAQSLVFSDNPSARAAFPGGITLERRYDTLCAAAEEMPIPETVLPCPGALTVPGFLVCCERARNLTNTSESFTVVPRGEIVVRSRLPGDSIRLSAGTKSLKKLFIDRKIPASERSSIPVICDREGILGVWGIGVNLDRAALTKDAVTIYVKKKQKDGGRTNGKRYSGDSADRGADSEPYSGTGRGTDSGVCG